MTMPSRSRCSICILKLRPSAYYPPLDVRPEFDTEIAGQVEPEVQSALLRAETHGVHAVRVPFVGKKSGAVVTAKAPGGERFAPAAGARKNGAAERMRRPAEEAGVERAIVSRILM